MERSLWWWDSNSAEALIRRRFCSSVNGTSASLLQVMPAGHRPVRHPWLAMIGRRLVWFSLPPGRRLLADALAVARRHAGQQVGCKMAVDVVQEGGEGGITATGAADLRPQIQALQFPNACEAFAQVLRPRIAGGLRHPRHELAGERAHGMARDGAAAPELIVASSEPGDLLQRGLPALQHRALQLPDRRIQAVEHA